MSVSMSPEAIVERLRRASDAADLRTERRLHAKIDMTPTGIVARLSEVEELRRTCVALGRLKKVEQ